MLKNYYRNTFRYLKKHPIVTTINLLGLSIGICVCFFSLLFVRFELSYDAYHAHADRIYRLVTNVRTQSGISYESTSAPMLPTIQANFTEVEAAARLCPDYLLVQKEDRSFYREEDIAYADASLFSVFSYSFISGNAATALIHPFQIVLSETAALRYFGTTDCLGNTLLLDQSPAEVSGVMKDMPHNSHFRTDILVSMSTLLQAWNPAMTKQWKRFGFYTYLLLNEDASATQLGTLTTRLIQSQMSVSETEYQMILEPLKDIYLHSKPRGSRYGSSTHGNLQHIYAIVAVAVLVLFIACFNFVNLTTALSLERCKEVGLRKTLGATRIQLIVQFLIDAVLLSQVAMVIATIISMLSLPVFQELSGKMIGISIERHFPEFLSLLAGTLLIGFVTGIYPALYLSRFSLQQGMAASQASTRKGKVIQHSLIMIQFVISLVLMMATVAVYQQLYYMQNHKLGFAKEHKLVIDFHYDHQVVNASQAIKNQLALLPGVRQLTFSSTVPGKPNRKYTTLIENVDDSKQEILSDVYFVDHDFLQQYQINVIAGRAFSKEITTDSVEAMLINEAMVKRLGYHYPDEVIGKQFEQKGSRGLIVGVVNDFHYHSFREDIRPLTLRLTPGWNLYTFTTLDIATSDVNTTLRQVKQRWESLTAGKPFTYFFVDDAYYAQYLTEARFGKIFTGTALMAILLSCLGLLGISILGIRQKFREIGIRKVLGATGKSIFLLLSQTYIKLILLAFVLAAPIANYCITDWLQTYAHRITLQWWLFVIPGLIVLLLALMTISSQTLKATRQNPVDSLRSE